MLIFKDVSFEYENQPVFNNLNLKIDHGEFIFLIGKSGVGKTTFLQMIYMDRFPQNGYVQFGNYSSDSIQPKEIPILRRKIGVIFQDFKLLRDRNVYDNLAFVLHVTGAPKKLIKKRIMNALTDVGLAHKQKNMPDELSGGEQQRIVIARAIINSPSLVIADEPTGNLDPETSLEILEILQKINRRGTGVIFATHNYELVKSVNARIIKLADGKAVQVVLKKKST
ncbi:MAG: cell division ATP-binding protein FtsE [Chlorobi bacterium]|nr:cell division ATP-binding protein FtsE [Chlorobiota bacterium]